MLVSDAADVVELVVASANSPRTGAAPYCPVTCSNRPPGGFWPRCLAALRRRCRYRERRTDDRGGRRREAVRTPITWFCRTTRRRLEVDTPGRDRGPARSPPVLTDVFGRPGDPPTALVITVVDPLRRSRRATAAVRDGARRGCSRTGDPFPFAHCDTAVTLRSRGFPLRQATRHQTDSSPRQHRFTADRHKATNAPAHLRSDRAAIPPAARDGAACARPLPRHSTNCAVVQETGTSGYGSS